MAGMARIRVGIETGGTFTDVVAIDTETGRVVSTKTPSTPPDPAEGFLSGLRQGLELLEAEPADVAGVVHGTTVATNHLLEGDVGRVGLITTEGYEFVLEIARQSVPDGYGNSYFWVKPPRLVPADLVKTVPGRLGVDGGVVRDFDEEAARAVAAWFREHRVDTIGVCFLHAYANPAHELAMRRAIEQEHPDAVVSLSSEVLPEYREYERTMTTLVDAAVKPKVATYVGAIAEGLGNATFAVMKSNGGVASASEVARRPITTVLSGPAAGALGAALIARNAGVDKVLTLDGGGTSTDVSVVLDGEPTLTTEGSVGAYPSRIPMIDVVTVGAGGGSVAWISPEGALKVGPRSAGADPGPLCYGKGGTEPTVTDAHVVLGHLADGAVLGGEVKLDRAAAERALGELDPAGVIEVVNANMARALRVVSVERGIDPRGLTLVAFGGAGPLHACALAEELGMTRVLVPLASGMLSALGLAVADLRRDYVGGTFEEMEARAAADLPRSVVVRYVDARYPGQSHELTIEDGADFHAAHEQ